MFNRASNRTAGQSSLPGSDALKPVDPPQRMSDRLHDTFSAITDAAVSDLSEWAEELTESELESLRDPRNWIRPVGALAAGLTGSVPSLSLPFWLLPFSNRPKRM